MEADRAHVRAAVTLPAVRVLRIDDVGSEPITVHVELARASLLLPDRSGVHKAFVDGRDRRSRRLESG